MEFHAFYTGASFDAHEYLGGHLTEEGAVFRTFAPSAEKISLIGEFSGWEELPMERAHDGNFWECSVPGARAGMMYKYRVYTRGGRCLDHCDPYGFYMELRPNSASILWDQSAYSFQDRGWRSRPKNWREGPLNVYEVHLGSWRRKPDGGWYTYRELAGPLISYVKELGYNALEFLPLAEHPSDSSWGYQITGFFSPTSRYGTPDDLKYLVDQCHRAGLAVLLDFVPAHFAVDDYGLWDYDGTALYQYPSPDVGNSAWGSCSFMHSRGEVRSFLNSAARFWLEEYHFDGLRVDAVRNLIYWNGEPARGENQGGLQFLRALNRGLKERRPHALLVAEDSSAYPGVTRPAEEGGLGFDLKWDLGWMHDTLSYFQAPPEERAGQGGKAHLLHGLLCQRALSAPPVPRRGGPRQGHHFAEDARGLRGEISPGPGPLPLYVRPPGEEAELHGQRAGPLPGVGRGPGAGLEFVGLPPPRRVPGLPPGR